MIVYFKAAFKNHVISEDRYNSGYQFWWVLLDVINNDYILGHFKSYRIKCRTAIGEMWMFWHKRQANSIKF